MDKYSTPFLLSIDYELFFGRHPGSVDKCLITPTNKIVKILDKYGMKVSLFVDAGYLEKLKYYGIKYPELAKDYTKIKNQLLKLSQSGHDIQLHIHPHWLDSTYTLTKGWSLDTRRYRLHDFSEIEIKKIVRNYKLVLQECTVNPIVAYRAGGWCLQPFSKIRSALTNNNIWIDSTVYKNGFSNDPTRHFDFRSPIPQTPWHFSEDPLIQDDNGLFLEIPISSIKTKPSFFWKLAFSKQFSKHRFKTFGDGSAMIAHKKYYFDRLTKTTYSPVMIDGVKAAQLQTAFDQINNSASTNSIFNVMGHPKSISPYSLSKLDLFLQANKNLIPITYQDFIPKHKNQNIINADLEVINTDLIASCVGK